MNIQKELKSMDYDPSSVIISKPAKRKLIERSSLRNTQSNYINKNEINFVCPDDCYKLKLPMRMVVSQPARREHKTGCENETSYFSSRLIDNLLTKPENLNKKYLPNSQYSERKQCNVISASIKMWLKNPFGKQRDSSKEMRRNRNYNITSVKESHNDPVDFSRSKITSNYQLHSTPPQLPFSLVEKNTENVCQKETLIKMWLQNSFGKQRDSSKEIKRNDNMTSVKESCCNPVSSSRTEIASNYQEHSTPPQLLFSLEEEDTDNICQKEDSSSSRLECNDMQNCTQMSSDVDLPMLAYMENFDNSWEENLFREKVSKNSQKDFSECSSSKLDYNYIKDFTPMISDSDFSMLAYADNFSSSCANKTYEFCKEIVPNTSLRNEPHLFQTHSTEFEWKPESISFASQNCFDFASEKIEHLLPPETISNTEEHNIGFLKSVSDAREDYTSMFSLSQPDSET